MGPRRGQHDLGFAVALAIASAAASGCNGDPDLPPIIWEGERLRYRTTGEESDICAGTFRYLDGRVGHLQSALNVPSRIVDFSWTPGNTLETYCDASQGCSDGERAFSELPACEHELFHAVRGSTSHRGLEEGMAVFFGDDREIPGEVGDDADSVLMAAGPTTLPPNRDYPTLGHLVSYLHAEFGIDALAEIDRRSSIRDEYAELSQTVLDALGLPLADVVRDYFDDYPVCDNRTYRYRGYECSAPLIDLPSVEGDSVALSSRVACDDPETVGAADSEIWTSVTFAVPSEGRYAVRVVPDNASAARLRLATCDTSCFEADLLPDFGDDLPGLAEHVFCLQPGAILMRLASLDGSAVSFDISIERFASSELCGE